MSDIIHLPTSTQFITCPYPATSTLAIFVRSPLTGHIFEITKQPKKELLAEFPTLLASLQANLVFPANLSMSGIFVLKASKTLSYWQMEFLNTYEPISLYYRDIFVLENYPPTGVL